MSVPYNKEWCLEHWGIWVEDGTVMKGPRCFKVHVPEPGGKYVVHFVYNEVVGILWEKMLTVAGQQGAKQVAR